MRYGYNLSYNVQSKHSPLTNEALFNVYNTKVTCLRLHAKSQFDMNVDKKHDPQGIFFNLLTVNQTSALLWPHGNFILFFPFLLYLTGKTNVKCRFHYQNISSKMHNIKNK